MHMRVSSGLVVIPNGFRLRCSVFASNHRPLCAAAQARPECSGQRHDGQPQNARPASLGSEPLSPRERGAPNRAPQEQQPSRQCSVGGAAGHEGKDALAWGISRLAPGTSSAATYTSACTTFSSPALLSLRPVARVLPSAPVSYITSLCRGGQQRQQRAGGCAAAKGGWGRRSRPRPAAGFARCWGMAQRDAPTDADHVSCFCRAGPR